MTISRIIFYSSVVLFGAFMVVYGGMDDSPGAQLIGLLAVIAGGVGVLRARKKDTE